MGKPSQRLYLLYHELRPSVSRYSYVVETAEFERHLQLFLQLRQSGKPGLWPEVTFDDGHESNFTSAFPLLQSNAIQALFFITVGWTDRRSGYMGWQQLRALHDAGQLIGAHGWTHTLLTHCGQRDLLTELNKAKMVLEDKLGTPITSMSLPGGRYNRRILDACQEAGYTRIFTSIPKAESEPAGLTVGRVNVRGDMQLERISKLLQPESNILSGMERQYRMKSAAKTLLGDQLYEKFWAVMNRKEAANEEEVYEDSAHH